MRSEFFRMAIFLKTLRSLGPAVFLFLFVTGGCAPAQKGNLNGALDLRIEGYYQGRVVLDGDQMRVTLWDVKTERLSAYKTIKPLSGGDRIAVYFDTDTNIEGAEYCVLFYSDEATLRQGDVKGPDDREIGVMPYRKEDNRVQVDIPLKYFEETPSQAWTDKIP